MAILWPRQVVLVVVSSAVQVVAGIAVDWWYLALAATSETNASYKSVTPSVSQGVVVLPKCHTQCQPRCGRVTKVSHPVSAKV
jgi:hypothetical protein